MLAKLSVDQALKKARSYVKKNEVAEAQKLYEAVLHAFPKNKRAQQALAGLKRPKQKFITQSVHIKAIDQLINIYNQGQFSIVVEQAQAMKEEYSETFVFWNILGSSAIQMDMMEDAIEAYKKCILLKPDFADAYYNMGIALKNQGKCYEAIESYKKCISLKPDFAQVYYNIGNIFKNKDKLEQAIASYKKCISLNPDYAEAYYNMGIVLKNDGKLDDAMAAYNSFILLKPNYAGAYNNVGNIFQDQGQLDKAIDAFNMAISLKDDYVDAYINMGVALKDQGKFDEAIKAYNKALSFTPNYVEAYNHIGNALNDQGKHEQAIEVYKKAVSLKPDYSRAHQNLSLTLLNSGSVEEGLTEYEWRWKTNKFFSQQRHFLQPLWDGKTSLSGKRILLWCEQGIGDTINWSSCISFVSSQAELCILECQEKLVPLLKRSFPNVKVKAVDRNFDLVRDDFDVHLPMGSLYKHFIEEITKNSKIKPFLITNPVRVKFWKQRLSSLGDGPYIGISWKSSDMSPDRLQNYALISELSPILKIPDVTLINLQYFDFKDDLAKAKNDLGVTVHNFDDLDHYYDIDNVTSLCAALDMVVSTKTTVPLISAGVGTPTKLANWRQSAWNNILLNPVSSSVDIFEKDTCEPWDNVFNLIAKDILKVI